MRLPSILATLSAAVVGLGLCAAGHALPPAAPVRPDPWQSDKMAARLQAATSSGRPVLLRVNYAGGHGNLGGTKAATERSIADIWTFLLWQFGMPGFQPTAGGH